MAKGPPEAEHLVWVIKGRASNQAKSLELYRLLNEHSAVLAKPSHRLRFYVQELLGISFSLWRAVFLADRTGDRDLKIEDARGFLGAMLTDNAISFVTDRKYNEWTFNHYIENARFRLEKIADGEYPPAPFAPKDIQVKAGKDLGTRKWERYDELFDKAVADLKARLATK